MYILVTRSLMCYFAFTDMEEFLIKKAELNDLQLKRQHQLYVSSGQLPIMQQVFYH